MIIGFKWQNLAKKAFIFRNSGERKSQINQCSWSSHLDVAHHKPKWIISSGNGGIMAMFPKRYKLF